MSQAKFLVTINSSAFSGAKVVCLGGQLKILLDAIGRCIAPNAIWGADLSVIGSPGKFESLAKSCPVFWGSTLSVMEAIDDYDQFESGVLFVLGSDTILNIESREIETDGKMFEDMGNSIFEIRMFDTTSFEIYICNEMFYKVFNDQINLAGLEPGGIGIQKT
jgi:hypothetical protein